MMKMAYWPRNKLEEYRSKCLRRVVKYAYDNVPFYHRRFREIGIRPDDVRTVNDLNKLPVVRREEIRDNAKDFVSTEYDVKKLKVLRTSGSTGQPLFLYISERENEFRKAKHLRANISCGQKPWHKWVVITSPHHFSETSRLQRLLRIYTPIPISVFEDVSAQACILKVIKPDVLDGYSSSLYLLANEVKKRGLKAIKPKFIIGGAEMISDSSVNLIEEVFGVPFYDQYACIEVERIAWQCREKVGYHLDADTLIVQFVDKDGEEVSFGECGEIICTSLFNFAMPLIRYAVGDLGRPTNEECPCGRKLPLMKVVEGRKDSIIVLPDGRLMSPRTFSVAVSTFKLYSYIEQFRIVQKDKTFFEVMIKLRDINVDRDAFEKELIGHLSKIVNPFGEPIDFRVRFVDNIPLEKSGKLRIVVSEISKPI